MTKKPKYLQHYQEKRCDIALYTNELRASNPADLFIVIPCYKENWTTVSATLASLANAERGNLSITTLILINYKESDSPKVKSDSQLLYGQLTSYSHDNPNLFVFLKELSGKHKGVGLARKLLMDAAFLHCMEYDQDSIIVNLDADTCIQPNYYQALYRSFEEDKSMEAGSIDFHHTHIESNDAILNYEFHLNYFIQMQRWVGLPFAYQTIGSAMAVKSYAYAKQGGMNLRQAGEDFYFLQKYAKSYTLRDVYTTTVCPSGRESDRVPFGTGKAVKDFNLLEQPIGTTYNPNSFILLKSWLSKIVARLIAAEDYQQSGNSILDGYLKLINARVNYEKILSSSLDANTRVRHFFIWFDAFLFFKYLHYCRDMGLDDVPNTQACRTLCQLKGWEVQEDLHNNLLLIREMGQVEAYHDQWRAGLISKPSITSAS